MASIGIINVKSFELERPTNKTLHESILEKFEFMPNTEELRRNVISFIDSYFAPNPPSGDSITNTKIHYYKLLLDSAQLSKEDRKLHYAKFLSDINVLHDTNFLLILE